ncbi:FecR domain-containing protein [Chitinophaga horti]|uniref:FecR domain-containing protein n=1 Tax=Chitinophaga horti TaxID=2920382 RepID=A0ABY6J2P2_9BACT|nr:FecR family protein [Chitinophaga horti]UYQ92636.1 FecR domain-containing protein [Chitinophaga horti]
MEPLDRITQLSTRAINRLATAAELEELCLLLQQHPDAALPPQLEKQLLAPPAADYDTIYWDGVADRILAADRNTTPVIPMRNRRRWMWAAAVAVVVAGTGSYLLTRTPATTEITTRTVDKPADIAPGGNKATLVLGDGSTISLDSATTGSLAQQGHVRVVKRTNGQLAYETAGAHPSGEILYNTIYTPRGGQYQVTLPDGSKVWLNAASSLRYPTTFTGKRIVELSGEAYFEIAANARQPFMVKQGSNTIEVLGTAFNVMAYADEQAVNTTLLSGAVKVNGRKINPGQCASISHSSGKLDILDHVNTEAAVAWKNGYIQFEGHDIRSAMRLISRWYDVSVDYRGQVPAHFRGTISSSVPVSEVLKMMAMTGEVNFEISGRTIIVTPGQ